MEQDLPTAAVTSHCPSLPFKEGAGPISALSPPSKCPRSVSDS